jgi:mono/diheme cytochrome c family protein
MNKLMSYLLLPVLMLPAVVMANTYAQKCGICHGPAGISSMSTVPNLADTKLTAAQILTIIENGRGKMPKISVDDAQKKDIVDYVVNNIKK